jgi:hypothetical protein
MELHLLSGVSQTLQTVAIATIIFSACLFLSQVNFRAQLAMAMLPAVAQPGNREKKRLSYLHAAKGLYAQGYKQVSVSEEIDQIIATGLTGSIVYRFSLPYSYSGWRGHCCNSC